MRIGSARPENAPTLARWSDLRCRSIFWGFVFSVFVFFYFDLVLVLTSTVKGNTLFEVPGTGVIAQLLKNITEFRKK